MRLMELLICFVMRRGAPGFACLLLSLSSIGATHAQEAQTTSPAASAIGDDAANTARAEEVLRRAVAASGGARYTGIRSVAGRGLFTPYIEGISGDPLRFDDYVVFPDKNRTEFRPPKDYVIQTRTPDTGWDYSAAARKITDAKPAQLADYRLALRTSLDSLLRGTWRAQGDTQARLSYVGRREAGVGQRNEVVRLTYADGFAVEFEFAARDASPAKIRYKQTRARENANGIEEPYDAIEEDRFAQVVDTNGVRLPFIIDHFRDGRQTSRVNYEAVSFDEPLPEDFFDRPADIKKLGERKKR